jgi:hypothetical protein
MRYVIVVLLCSVVAAACGASTTEEVREYTLPEPLFSTKLPDPPEKAPPDKRMALPVSECVVEGSEPPQKTPPGILMSEEMALSAARLRVSYDELRGLYKTDLATMEREREVYQRHLDAADDEIEVWRTKARRTWLEKHGGQLGLAIGVVAGAALAVGIAAAFEGVREGIE